MLHHPVIIFDFTVILDTFGFHIHRLKRLGLDIHRYYVDSNAELWFLFHLGLWSNR